MPPAGPDGGRTPGPPLPLPLPLPLAAPAALPGPVEPEVAIPCEAAFDHPDWRFSVDWAGMRVVLAASAAGGVRIHDENLRDVTALLPELEASARPALGGRGAVLDGVVTVLDGEGCPDLEALTARLWAPAARGRSLAPVALLVTDLLHLDGASLLAWPFDRRREALRRLLAPAPHVQVPDWVEEQGTAIAAAAAQRGLGAVLARHGSAPYHPGVPSPQRLRVALADEVDCVVAGLVAGTSGGADALLLAEWVDGRLVDAGRVPVHSPGARRWVAQRSRSLVVAEPALEAPAAVEPGTAWLRPVLVATVRFSGRAADDRLRLPSLVAVRDDVDPVRCRRREPVPPPPGRTRGPAGFRPTVLTTLPFDG